MLQALEDKYGTAQNIQLALQAEILELHHKMTAMQRPTTGESAPLSDEQGMLTDFVQYYRC